MSDSVRMQPGDVYCPNCQSELLTMWVGSNSLWQFTCEGCGLGFEHPFRADADGRFEWIWDAEHPKPNPGCPWCGTCNIYAHSWLGGENYTWRCNRQSCEKFWRGRWTRHGSAHNWRDDRWTIRVPVSEVPWASGTLRDLQCYRRCLQAQRFGNGHSNYFPQCCRWPKSCSAFDPGFQYGEGPTTLPIVWFDGFGWRSGPPDQKLIPQRWWGEMLARWQTVNPGKKVSDDEHDGEDTGCGNPGCPCYDGT